MGECCRKSTTDAHHCMDINHAIEWGSVLAEVSPHILSSNSRPIPGAEGWFGSDDASVQ